ncbi:MAG: protein kinase [Gemmatimonadota bacterium]|nr:protein kinase [Gemmatimonadota bacterium]
MSTQPARLSAALAGRYRIERELGAGGMATVYLAFDEKHDRKVAIKVLKPELAAVLGAERFVVEIKTTAAMSHPHILPLFDSGTADGFLFYVMPYIQGETIRERLNRETQFGVEEAVRIAREIADALDYAHRHGVIHRDIKPENILLHDGRAMVMDFGIALAVSAAAGGRMTETGLSLGTPHYMSPEQATAEKEISPRSDVYSLASVLYEMLAGQPPHVGGSAQQIIMKIITEQPQPVRQLRKNVPPNVEGALAKALEKLPADRFHSAKDFGDALQATHFTHTFTGAATAGAGASPASRRLALGAAAVAMAGLAVGAWGWARARAQNSAPIVALTLELPGSRPDLSRFAVSHDGSRYAFSVGDGIVVRDSGSREYRLLPGTANGESPSFSPDGAWLVYQTQGRLRKIALTGGASVSVIPNDSLRAGRVRWGADGTIVFENASRLYTVSPTGSLRLLSKTDRAESPRMMPDGSGVFYVDQRSGSKLMFYDLASDTAYMLIEDSGEGQYLPSGHLLYTAANGGLFAVPFDARARRIVGTPVSVAADMQSNGGVSPFDVTTNGTLVYRAGIDMESRVLVRERNGKTDTLPIAPRIISYVRLSPDSRSLALTVGSARGTNRHTAIYDLALGSLTRFTQEGGGHAPIWSPDGQRIAFTADIAGGDAEDVFVQPIDRSSPPVRVLRMANDQHSVSWPVDTTLVVANASAPGGLGMSSSAGGEAASVHTVNPATPGAGPKPYLSAAWSQSDAAVSPDGKWAAFTSLETGTPEVFVRAFPEAGVGGITKVSTAGGMRARWSGDGRTIFYHALDDRTIKSVRVTTGVSVTVGATETVMTVPDMLSGWDVDRRSGRMYVTQAVGGDQVRIVVIQNWLADFTRRQATRK